MLDRLIKLVSKEGRAEARDAKEAAREPFSQPQDASALVKRRRVKRRVKAGVSVAVAIAAGAFLSCQRAISPPDSDQPALTPDARVEPEQGKQLPTTTGDNKEESPAEPPTDKAAPPAENLSDVGQNDAEGAELKPAADSDASGDANADVEADKPDALVPKVKRKRRRKVDRREHRKGMPVRDNLLE